MRTGRQTVSSQAFVFNMVTPTAGLLFELRVRVQAYSFASRDGARLEQSVALFRASLDEIYVTAKIFWLLSKGGFRRESRITGG